MTRYPQLAIYMHEATFPVLPPLALSYQRDPLLGSALTQGQGLMYL